MKKAFEKYSNNKKKQTEIDELFEYISRMANKLDKLSNINNNDFDIARIVRSKQSQLTIQGSVITQNYLSLNRLAAKLR